MEQFEPIFDYQFRLILIGDSTVGKSSLLRFFCDGKFSEISDPTIGVDFYARLVTTSDNTKIKLQIWDTAGQERFRSITKSYYRNSVGVLLLYSVTDRKSFEQVPMWKEEATKYISPHKPVFSLVGCKSDLANAQVSPEESQRFAANYSMDHHTTSSKTGQNVEQVFQSITEQILAKLKNGELKILDDWDGIKRGYSGKARNDNELLQGEAVSKCC